MLRELAQAPDADLASFQDTERHRFFNTNSLWIDLAALDQALSASGGALDLPLIVNRKTVDPKDPDSTPVVQLETAMGAAIDVWPGAQAIRVSRTRYAPVKTTNDLLAVRSDAFEVTEDSRITLVAERDGTPPLIELDPEHFKLLGDFERRFAHGPPSLAACDRFAVRGDVRFGADVVVRGEVEIGSEGEATTVEDGTVLEG